MCGCLNSWVWHLRLWSAGWQAEHDGCFLGVCWRRAVRFYFRVANRKFMDRTTLYLTCPGKFISARRSLVFKGAMWSWIQSLSPWNPFLGCPFSPAGVLDYLSWGLNMHLWGQERTLVEPESSPSYQHCPAVFLWMSTHCHHLFYSLSELTERRC